MIKSKLKFDTSFIYFPFMKALPPNAWTIVSLISALVGSFLFIYYDVWVGLFLFMLSILLDAVDGVVARATNSVTPFGAFLDGTIDRVVEFLLILSAIIVFPFITIPAVLVLFFGSCMTSFVKAYASHRGVVDVSTAASLGGLLERAERTILLLISVGATIQNPHVGVVLFYITAVLSFITFVERVYYIYKHSKVQK